MGWVRYKFERSTERVARSPLRRSSASRTRSRGESRLLPIATYAGRQSESIFNCAPLRRAAAGGGGPRRLPPPRVPQVALEQAPPAAPAASFECRSTSAPIPDPPRRLARAATGNRRLRENADVAEGSTISHRCDD